MTLMRTLEDGPGKTVWLIKIEFMQVSISPTFYEINCTKNVENFKELKIYFKKPFFGTIENIWFVIFDLHVKSGRASHICVVFALTAH